MKEMLFKSISQIENNTLEDILRKYFGCSEEPFLETPITIADSDYCEAKEFLTPEGAEAYDKLTDLIYDLGKIVYGFDANMVVDELDSIVSQFP